jgi:16S rRNA (uracil1498-N3)-methyltransferase
VLRLAPGDDIFLTDGKGNFYEAEVTLAANHHCGYRILQRMPQPAPWWGHIHLAMAPTKMMERMEWMIEKTVEIGVDEISFLNCQFSERTIVKMPRAEKIVIAATKQSRKPWLTELHEMVNFDTFVRQPRNCCKYIAHCYEEIPRSYLFDELRQPSDMRDAMVLIGPEGDFSIDEVRLAVANGYKSVHLGNSRLRTETAGLAAVMMMQLSKE